MAYFKEENSGSRVYERLEGRDLKSVGNISNNSARKTQCSGNEWGMKWKN